MAKKLFLMLFLLILAEAVSAAIIHGSVYDLSLNEVTDVMLEIDTTPKQQYISKDGDYEFNVQVTAEYNQIYGRFPVSAAIEDCSNFEITIDDVEMCRLENRNIQVFESLF